MLGNRFLIEKIFFYYFHWNKSFIVADIFILFQTGLNVIFLFEALLCQQVFLVFC
mgnify:CR=1 FL=1